MAVACPQQTVFMNICVLKCHVLYLVEAFCVAFAFFRSRLASLRFCLWNHTWGCNSFNSN